MIMFSLSKQKEKKGKEEEKELNNGEIVTKKL